MAYLDSFKKPDQWGPSEGGLTGSPPPSSDYAFDIGKFAGWGKEDFLWKLMAGSFPGALNSAYFGSSWGQPKAQQETVNQYGLLTPEGARARTEAVGRANTEDAARRGGALGRLFTSLGLSPAASAGAMVDEQNKGRMATADFAAQNLDPLQLSRQRMQVVQGVGSDPSTELLTRLFGQPSKLDQNRPSFLTGLAGLLGSVPWKG